jgi:hypothetical protein
MRVEGCFQERLRSYPSSDGDGGLHGGSKGDVERPVSMCGELGDPLLQRGETMCSYTGTGGCLVVRLGDLRLLWFVVQHCDLLE